MAFTRLGLETANVPHADRYGLLWLERGSLFVEKGTLRFACAGSPNLAPGAYDIPYQTVSMILLGPGTTVSHDVFRLAASHGMGLIAVGTGGVRMYTHRRSARTGALLPAGRSNAGHLPSNAARSC